MIFILTLVKTFKERDKRLAGASKLVELIFRDGESSLIRFHAFVLTALKVPFTLRKRSINREHIQFLTVSESASWHVPMPPIRSLSMWVVYRDMLWALVDSSLGSRGMIFTLFSRLGS